MAIGACAIALACGSGDTTTPRTPALGHVLAAVFAAAETITEPWRCAAPDTPELEDTELAVGGRTWHLGGHALRRTGADAEVVIGVVADAAGAAPRTIAALGRLRAAFDAARADLVLALGGMGSDRAELAASLGTLSDGAAFPVVALPGDLEAMPGHVAAIAELRARGDAIVDGRLVRWIELPNLTIGTIPGAGATERLVASDEGCAWRTEDVASLYSALTARPHLRILATAEAPRQQAAGEPAGVLALSPGRAQPIDLVLHGPVHPEPTPAKTGRRNGAGVLLSPGTADAIPRLPRAHRPAAGVLVVRGASWSWRPLRDAK